MAKETEQPQYEEFDYISDFYQPIKEVEEKYSSPILARLRKNEIDPYEFLGEEKVEGTGVVKKITDKTELEEGKQSFSQSVLDFLKDTPEALAISTAEAGANLSNNVVQLFGFGSNRVFKGTEKGQFISDATTEFAQGYNKSTEEFIGKLKQYAEDNDVNGVTQLMTDIGIDIGATVPIQKMLKKVGVPSYVATPLSFGLAYGFTGGDKETEMNMFIDSEAINALNEALGALPDTPEAKVAELVNTTFEGTVWGALGDRIVKVFKVLKNNVPAYMNQQTATSVGGAAATGEGAMQIQENAEQNQDFSQEKKTLNFDEQSQISSPMPDDNEMASAGLGPVFRSILKETAKKLSNKGSGEQFLGQLKNTPGLKQQELKWSGLDDFLKNKKNVTKEEVKDYLEKNSLDVSEISLPRVTKEAEEIKKVLDSFKKDGQSIYDEVGNLPMYQGRMQNFKEYTLTNILEDGTRVNEGVTARVLDDSFIGKRIQTYMPEIKDIKGNRDYIDLKKLSNDFGKKGDPDTLEFYVFENDKTGNIIAYPKSKIDGLNKFGDPFAGGQFVFTNITEMNIKEAEKLAFNIAEETLQKSINVLSPKPKFSGPGYVEPGGKDYKELIFKLKGDRNYPIEQEKFGFFGDDMAYSKRVKSEFPYTSPNVHFGTKNEFAHVRFKTRDLNGQKVLTVEEMQSDIVQDMKRAFDERVKDFPFKNNWYELVTKRLIRYAADNNLDAVAIPKANQIMSRYKQEAMAIDNLNIKVIRHPRGSMFLDEKDGMTSLYPKDAKEPNLYRFVVNYKEGDKVQRSLILDKDEIFESLDGYKVSEKIKNQVSDVLAGKGKFTADELTIDAPINKMIVGSGKGKVQLYNQAIPSFLKKYGKKWNAKVYDDVIETSKDFGQVPSPKGMPVTIIQLTDDMKKSVQQDGQALFEIFGIGSATAVGANAVSDSIENNIISQTTN